MKKIHFIISLFVLAITLGCTDDNSTIDLDAVSAPINIAALTTVTQDNTGKVTFLPKGEGVTQYEIYFGDGTTAPANVGPGQTTTHKYAEGVYQAKIVATTLNGKTTEITQEVIVSFKAPENLKVVITNDLAVSKKVTLTATADFALFYDVYFGEAGKPEPISANNGASVSYVYQEAGVYKIRVVSKSAAIKTTEETKDFTVTLVNKPSTSATTPPNRIATDVIAIYSSKYTNIAGTDFNPNWGQSGTYAEFDLNGDKMLNYIKLSYQGIDIGSSIDASIMETLHIDVWSADNMSIDIYPLPNGVQQADERFVRKTLVPNQWNSFDIPLSDFTSQGLPLNNLKQFKFVGNPFGAGTVFIDNIYFYKVPTVVSGPTAAPTPTLPAAKVISMFSNAYTNVNVDTWRTSWSSVTLEDITISGNATKKYSALDVVGIQTASSQIDATAMTHFHTDIWSSDLTTFKIKLVDFGANGVYDGPGAGDDKEHEITFASPAKDTWVSLDIPLSDFAGLTTRAHITQLIYVGAPSGNTTVYIDNVYFHN